MHQTCRLSTGLNPTASNLYQSMSFQLHSNDSEFTKRTHCLSIIKRGNCCWIQSVESASVSAVEEQEVMCANRGASLSPWDNIFFSNVSKILLRVSMSVAFDLYLHWSDVWMRNRPRRSNRYVSSDGVPRQLYCKMQIDLSQNKAIIARYEHVSRMLCRKEGDHGELWKAADSTLLFCLPNSPTHPDSGIFWQCRRTFNNAPSSPPPVLIMSQEQEEGGGVAELRNTCMAEAVPRMTE
jgi:hypothetical protein